MPSRRPRIVFAGGGHTALGALLNTRKIVDQGIDVVLIAPERYHYYSGMAPGMISHIYDPFDARIDIRYLVQMGGGTFIKDRVTRIDHENNRVILQNNDPVEYDALASNLGSQVNPAKKFTGDSMYYARNADNIFPAKPVYNMHMLRRKLETFVPGDCPRMLVIGGGVGGTEIAANSTKYLRQRGMRPRTTLVHSRGRLLAHQPPKAGRLAEKYLDRLGVEVIKGVKAREFTDRVATLEDGREIPFDVMAMSVGFNAPETFKLSGMKTGADGSLWVDDHLRSVTAPNVFGGGDNIAFNGDLLPRVGIYAIRQAPVLYHNLVTYIRGGQLQRHVPQGKLLLVLNLGEGDGLFVWGNVIFTGRLAWRIKHYIDHNWIGQYQYPGIWAEELMAYTGIMGEDEPVLPASEDAAIDEMAYAKGSGTT